MQLVIASQNMHKIRECRAILKALPGLDVLSLMDFPKYTPPPETGSTFEENAILKAVHAADALNHWVIADDSGLVVPSLNGAPGVFSARYCGAGAADKDNRQKLLHEMSQLKDGQRDAQFECCIALASPDGLKKCVHGICHGTIATQERGSRGHGYDPLFVKFEYSKTFGELDEDTKNRISHRRKALDKILILVESL